MGQDGLGQDLGDGGAVQHRGHPGQREAVLWAEREHHGVVVGGRLELEIEGDAEPFAQSQPEGAVDKFHVAHPTRPTITNWLVAAGLRPSDPERVDYGRGCFIRGTKPGEPTPQ